MSEQSQNQNSQHHFEQASSEELVQTESGRFFLKDTDQEFVQTDSGRFVFKTPDRTYSYELPRSDWPPKRSRWLETLLSYIAILLALAFAVFFIWYTFFTPNPFGLFPPPPMD